MNMGHAMSAVILRKPVEVDNRLRDLGLERESLLEVVEAVEAAKAECTDNDPASARGWSGWRWGNRRLREKMLSHEDWERDNADQICAILNRRLGIRVTVANTDDRTGTDLDPQTQTRRGPATDRAVSANQLSFLDVLDRSAKVVPLSSTRQEAVPIRTYYLCVYSEGDEIRAELSCPVSVDGGYFDDFVERIILIGDDGIGGSAIRRAPDGDGDGEFDIPVKRKRQ